jgi:hypothetical protein
MSTKIIDYTLDTSSPANPDASCPATTVGSCPVVAGPHVTTLGDFPKAVNFGASGELVTTLPVAGLNRSKFAVRLVFRVDAVVTSTQTLAESNALPFSFSMAPGSGSSDFFLVASVTTNSFGTGSASTQYLLDLHVGTWYTADLVYDTDTLAVFVDGVIYTVHAFPEGTLGAGTADQLFIGRAGSNTSQFTGKLAALQLHADIPIELETQLDEFRSHPQWFLTYKEEEIKYTLAFGVAVGEFYFDFASSSWVQPFANGILMYNDSNGQSFAMHGAILTAYWALPIRAAIGYLVSDEMPGARGGSRKSLFSSGGMYWSSQTGAIPVLGQIWVDYESNGESAWIGLPTAAEAAIGGGRRQFFQNAQMYWRNGSARAFMVMGAILAKFLNTGGTAAWGFPVSHESDILNHANIAIGRISEFEGCSIYWSGATGAAIVYGDIRDKYRSVGGPTSELGFPTSDESDAPGAAAPARINSFQHGSIAWFGSPSDTYVCLAFDITLGTVDTVECEGFLMGQNDLYMHATIDRNGFVVYSERLPADGDHGGNNIWELDKTFSIGPDGIIPNDINLTVGFGLDVWDADPWDDDHLGNMHATLNAANAWGRRGNPTGLQNSGSFDNINNISWAVSRRVNESALTPAKKWWGVRNAGTDPITYEEYATAFRDVDSAPEWWDITDWLAKLFYEAVVKHVAAGGNCFGMSLEAIYSKKHRALLTEPIDQYTTWDPPIVHEFNVKHEYQVGASALWWFVGEFLTGQTHDPVNVFHATRNAFNAGCDPVVCIAQNYDFSGAPHCILPVGWHDEVTPWEIDIRDPNFQTTDDNQAPRKLYVDPVANTFTYDGGNMYSGGAWTGGRFHYMPFDVVNDQPRTPLFEAIMLLLAGTILILGSDSQTASLTDENGVDLNAFGPDAVGRLQAGRTLTNKFVPVKGFFQPTSDGLPVGAVGPAGGASTATPGAYVRDCLPTHPRPKPQVPPGAKEPRPRPHGAIPAELHMRSNPRHYSRISPTKPRAGDDWQRLTLKEYLCQVAPVQVRETMAKQPEFVAQNQGRLMMHLADEGVLEAVLAAAGSRLTPIVDSYPAISPNFIHHTHVVRGGQFLYAVKQGLSQMVVTAPADTGELHVLKVKDLGTHSNAVTLTAYRDKVVSLHVHNKLGVTSDYLRMQVDNIPLAAGGDLLLNIKPGIGGLELVSAGQTIQATVTFDYLRRSDSLSSRFALDGQDGLRILPSTFITDNLLKVSRIANLFGQSLGSTSVLPMP